MLRGMKQTEIGLIPEDWEVYSIEKLVADKILEKPLDGNHGNIHPKSCDFVDEGIPFIMASDVYNNRINFSTCYHITKLQADKLQKGFSISGDVLLTHKGTVGNTAIVPEISFPYIMLTPQVTYYRVLDFCRLNNIFLKNVLDSKNLQDQIDSISGSGATRAYIGITQQRTLQIPLPPLPEQEAIAGALSDADAWIESLEQLIAKKRLIKQGAMQELLTPKEGWEVKKLGEVADFFKGRGLPKSQLNEGGKLKCIHYGELFTKYKELIGTIRSRTDTVDIPFLSKTNDVLMPTSDVTPRGLATASCIMENGVVLGGDILIIRFKSSIDGVFFSYFISNNKEEVLKFVSGSTVYHLYGKELSNLNFHFPKSLTEQTRIAIILSDMDAELEALEQQLHKARQIKQGMMQELLTGRIRLNYDASDGL